MLKMSRSVEYGLIAVDYLNSLSGGLATARDMSDRFDLPSGVVAKILQRLAAAGITVSEQGAHGGYRLGCSLDDVSFLQLSRAIEGEHHLAPCGDPEDCNRRDTCTVCGPVEQLDMRITGLLSGISLGELLAPSLNAPSEGVVV